MIQRTDFGVLYGQKTTEDALLIYSSYEDAKASPNKGDFIVLTPKSEVRWIKWTPKSGKIQRRRCQIERDSARQVYEGVSRGSGETGNGREYLLTGGSSAVVFGAVNARELGEGL